MKKNKLILALLVGFGSVLVACDKDKKEPVLPVMASIHFTEPGVSDTIAYGETLDVEGTIASSDNFYGYTLSLTNLETESIYYQMIISGFFIDDAFQAQWINDVTDTCIVRVKMDVELEEGGDHVVSERRVVCLPN